MKTKNVKNLVLNKTSISVMTELTGGKALPTTTKTNVTCGGICENSVIVCNEK